MRLTPPCSSCCESEHGIDDGRRSISESGMLSFFQHDVFLPPTCHYLILFGYTYILASVHWFMRPFVTSEDLPCRRKTRHGRFKDLQPASSSFSLAELIHRATYRNDFNDFRTNEGTVCISASHKSLLMLSYAYDMASLICLGIVTKGVPPVCCYRLFSYVIIAW